MKFNKETWKYLIFGLISLALIPLSNIVLLFEPLYENVYYGTLTKLYNDILKLIFWIVSSVILSKVSKKVLGFNPLRSPVESRKEELPIKNVILLTLIAASCIALVSYNVGWQVKILADLGERYTGLQLELALGEWASVVGKMFVVIMMLNFFQEGMEKSYPTKFIPWGGILLFFTFGLYELIAGSTTMPLVYLGFTLVYGIIHLLTHKNFFKSIFLIYFIYLL